jgi:hypothetical protein
MHALAELQSRMASALLAAEPAEQELPAALFTGANSGANGLRVHRNTVLGAISNALRHSYAAVERLVGADFFDRLAVEYARAAPPRAPQLDEYGGDFPDFIGAFPGTETLPYLAELARFEWQLDLLARRRAQAEPAGAELELDGGVRLRFSSTLRVHRFAFPVEALRAAILEEDLLALRALVGEEPGGHAYALWREAAGVKVSPLSAASARLLTTLLAGAGSAAALAAAAGAETGAAAGGDDEAALAQLLAREILPSGFVKITRETT